MSHAVPARAERGSGAPRRGARDARLEAATRLLAKLEIPPQGGWGYYREVVRWRPHS